jgi:hypothetical protein
MTLAALPGQMPTIDVPENSVLGATTSAGLGAMLLIGSFWSTKLEVGFFRGYLGGLLDKWTKGKFDWKSLLYWLAGAAGLTAILGTAGATTAEFITWIQERVVDLSEFPIIGDFGTPVICLIMLFMAMRKQGDSRPDIVWGIACAIVWPLGGGWWTESSLQLAHLMSQAATWGAA